MSPWISWPYSRKVLPTSRALIRRLCAIRPGLDRLGLRRLRTRQRLRALVEVATRAPHRADVVQRRRLGAAAVLDQSAAVGEDAAAGGLARPGEKTGDRVQHVAIACRRRGAGCSAAGQRCTDGARRGGRPAQVPPRSSSPAYRTPTRSHILAITPRLWLMNSSEVPNSWRSALTRSSTSASTVASSAVVGSSRISSDGSDGQRHRDHGALEHAARQLVRIAVHHARPDLRCAPCAASPR